MRIVIWNLLFGAVSQCWFIKAWAEQSLLQCTLTNGCTNILKALCPSMHSTSSMTPVLSTLTHSHYLSILSQKPTFTSVRQLGFINWNLYIKPHFSPPGVGRKEGTLSKTGNKKNNWFHSGNSWSYLPRTQFILVRNLLPQPNSIIVNDSQLSN